MRNPNKAIQDDIIYDPTLFRKGNDMNEDRYVKAKKEIFQQTKDIPSLTDLQLKQKYKELKDEDAPKSSREWLLEAVVRLIQNQYYIDNDLEIPKTVEKNFNDFFKQKVPKKKKNKTPRKKNSIDRETLNRERIRILELVANLCAEIVPNGNITFHPERKYATIKSDKSVVMFIEKKLRKVIAFMGGERGRSENPRLDIKIGIEDSEIKPLLETFIEKHLENFMHKRDKRWSQCEYVLEETIKHFKDMLDGYTKIHSHPSGRYTTFKKNRMVLIYITQDRAKGEIAFHPGGERENDPNLTTIIKVNEINNSVDVRNIVKEFLNTHYKNYIETKESGNKRRKEGMKRIMDVCSNVVKNDKLFHHPRNLFAIIKNEDRPIIMIKTNSENDTYKITAWIKKQKNNPEIEVSIEDNDEEIMEKTKKLIEEHMPFAIKGVEKDNVMESQSYAEKAPSY